MYVLDMHKMYVNIISKSCSEQTTYTWSWRLVSSSWRNVNSNLSGLWYHWPLNFDGCLTLSTPILAAEPWTHVPLLSIGSCSWPCLYAPILISLSVMSSSHHLLGLAPVHLQSILPSSVWTQRFWVLMTWSKYWRFHFLTDGTTSQSPSPPSRPEQTLFQSPSPPEQTRLSGDQSFWFWLPVTWCQWKLDI